MKDPNLAVDFIIASAPKFAQAKANRIYIENYLRTKKALLMAESAAKTSTEREQYAYGHDEYAVLLSGLREAVEIEERLKWELTAAQARIEVWRSQEATNRAQDKAAQ